MGPAAREQPNETADDYPDQISLAGTGSPE